MKRKSNETNGRRKVNQKFPGSVKARTILEYVKINSGYLEDDLKQM